MIKGFLHFHSKLVPFFLVYLIPLTSTYLRELLTRNNLSGVVIDDFLRLTEIFMKLNCFQIKASYFEQLKRTAMGNSLSLFITKLFMVKFEIKPKNELQYFTIFTNLHAILTRFKEHTTYTLSFDRYGRVCRRT